MLRRSELLRSVVESDGDVALPARLSVTSESRTNCFRVAIRVTGRRRRFAPLTLRNGNR